MAWNPSPEVAVARDAAKKLDADRCIVIYTRKSDGRFAMATFGETKALCTETKNMGDTAFDAIAKEYC